MECTCEVWFHGAFFISNSAMDVHLIKLKEPVRQHRLFQFAS
jgi:hypothetical protein